MPTSTIKYLFFACVMGLLTWACINPITDFKQIDATSYMTIEADIADDSELCKIRITSSSNRILSQNPIPVNKAEVYVTDQTGVKTIFKEGTIMGTYLPPAGFVGKVGYSYTLNVKTLTGKQYASVAETMVGAPEIENIVTQFEVRDQYAKVDLRRTGYSVYVDFKDSPKEGEFYMWNWKHFEKLNICETCEGGATWNFKTNVCVAPRVPTEDILNYQCDGNCWAISTNNDLNVFSDVLTNGQRLVGRQVARVPFDGYSPYYLRLEQRSITKTAFNFYQSLISQVQSSGSLFDVPAETRFSMNIKSVSDPAEKILGILNVFSVRKKIYFIDRSKNIPAGEFAIQSTFSGEIYTCPPGAVNCVDKVPCVESAYRTKITPEGWK
jgi:hypothetical protein